MVVSGKRPPGVSAFFGRLGEAFVAGRLDEVAASWSFPCPIAVEGRLVLMRSPEVFRTYLEEQRAAAVAAGLSALTPRISAIEMPRNGRFRVWLRWLLRFGDREEEEHHGMVYFMAGLPDGRLTIEMMDIVPVPLDEASAQSA